jgi:osmoprotectant transport system permease protein
MTPFIRPLGFLGIFLLPLTVLGSDQVVVGSKIFTESYILGEIAAQVLEENPGVTVDRKLGLGSTGILVESLKSGAIDLYPDYSGTLAEAILKKPKLKTLAQIKRALKPLGLTISGSLGFNDTYALAVKESFAEQYHLKTMSDLRSLPVPVRAAFSYEFMDRADGYQGMVKRYHFQFAPGQVSRMEHSLVYGAIDQNKVDMIEVYSTDANIQKFKLRVLEDDRGYFPAYQAVWVARLSFVKAHPDLWADLRKVENSISADKMVELNSRADLDKISYSQIASGFLGRETTASPGDAGQIWERTKEHLGLVGFSLLFSVLVGIPLGVLAARHRRMGQGILIFSALFQTIPTLALLCFLIPVFGIGLKPALAALCLYSLLPVVLNTYTGIGSIDPKHLENAKAFGLSPWQILCQITLPLASPMILAGVKTATIVSIGTATLAALVGAGGYGALIISGLSLNHIPTILMGAIPAAVMALLAHFLFDLLEFWIVPKGLRKPG